jgi:glycine cleavage system regulatory protein
MERIKITNWDDLIKIVENLKEKDKALLLYATISNHNDKEKLINPELIFALVDARDSTPICDKLTALCKMEVEL